MTASTFWLSVLLTHYEQCCYHNGCYSRIRFRPAVPRLHVSARTEPPALFSSLAVGVGRVLTALRSRHLPVLVGGFLCEPAFSGRHGSLRSCLDAAHARAFPLPMV